MTEKSMYYVKSVWSNVNNWDDKANKEIEKAYEEGYEPISIACYNGPFVILFKLKENSV